MEHNFLKLGIWERSRKLVVEIYKLTKKFPDSERFGLTSQIQRCAVSVPSNISEGSGRGTTPQLKHFLDISIGSICELETQLFIAYDLEYIQKEEFELTRKEITEVRKMIVGFKNSL